jgi:hypothetical protein
MIPGDSMVSVVERLMVVAWFFVVKWFLMVEGFLVLEIFADGGMIQVVYGCYSRAANNAGGGMVAGALMVARVGSFYGSRMVPGGRMLLMVPGSEMVHCA